MKVTDLSGLYASNDVSILFCGRELFQNVRQVYFSNSPVPLQIGVRGLA